MAKRKRIGLIYKYDEAWIGGTYYIDNIISALNSLEKKKQPKLFVYTNSQKVFRKLKKKSNYKKLYFRSLEVTPLNSLKVSFNRVSRKFFKKNYFNEIPQEIDLDWVFPNPVDFIFSKIDSSKKVYWIADFQELHLPHFFSEEDIQTRKAWQKHFVDNAKTIVFSSLNARNDFDNLYPDCKAKKILLPFAVTTNSFSINPIMGQSILEKYNIDYNYFFVPNQLWIHKNHKVVLKSIKEIKNRNKKVLVLFSGREEDYRFPDYPNELKQMLVDLDISDMAIFLGFIPKIELDYLVNNSIAIIQPSLFEGWSTTIEEAKSYNKYVIASDIDIHKEQLEKYPNKRLFDKHDSNALADILIDVSDNSLEIKDYNYQRDIHIFANSFMSIP